MATDSQGRPESDSLWKRRSSSTSNLANLPQIDIERARRNSQAGLVGVDTVDLRLGWQVTRVVCTSPVVTVDERYSSDDVREEGKELFSHFVLEEIQKEGLDQSIICSTPLCSTPQEYKNKLWAKTGKELRIMADEFAKTKERQRVRQRANRIGINEITYEQFKDLLSQLFLQGDITRERIIVLFFFCSDLAIRTLKEKAINLFQRLFDWSINYITETVCAWVQQRGGWGAVVSNSVQKFSTAALVVVGVALAIGIYRWFRHK